MGSLTAFFLAQKLVKTFSGKGLVPEHIAISPVFVVAVILGAGTTVLMAARMGQPISTTHSLVGALVGGGWASAGQALNLSALGKNFVAPLILSPFIAVGLTVMLYLFFRSARRAMRVEKETCLCVGKKIMRVPHLNVEPGGVLSATEFKGLDLVIENKTDCQVRAVETYSGKLFGIYAQNVLNTLHFLSAGAVSFARGLNDTPKLVGLVMAVSMLGLQWNIGLVAIAIALGGLLSARRVASTVSYDITKMNHGQGFTANFVTAILVIFASKFGMPVSTTHVSCGALFGIGLVGQQTDWRTVWSILMAWIFTLPVAAFLSMSLYVTLQVVTG